MKIKAAVAAVDWKGVPSARLARMDKPLRILRLWRAEGDQKSPLRRCFKSRRSGRPRYAGFASGCRLIIGYVEKTDTSGRLSGLLSGCPPTDTRPQARAKLGNAQIGSSPPHCKRFFRHKPFIVPMVAENLTQHEKSRLCGGFHSSSPATIRLMDALCANGARYRFAASPRP